MSRTAVVLFNLGGPDRPQSVRPFLFNLFNDHAIVALPQPLRWFLAAARQYRGAGARARDGARPRASLLRRHALLAPVQRRSGARGQGMGPRSHRAAAALSAIFDDDDGILARRLARRGTAGRDERADGG